MDRARVDIQLRASTIKEEAAQKRERLSAEWFWSLKKS